MTFLTWDNCLRHRSVTVSTDSPFLNEEISLQYKILSVENSMHM